MSTPDFAGEVQNSLRGFSVAFNFDFAETRGAMCEPTEDLREAINSEAKGAKLPSCGSRERMQAQRCMATAFTVTCYRTETASGCQHGDYLDFDLRVHPLKNR